MSAPMIPQPIHCAGIGGRSRVIQGFFVGGRPTTLQPAAPPPIAPRPTAGSAPALAPASARPRPAGIQPKSAGPIFPKAQQSSLPPTTRPSAVQPSGGNAFALPPTFHLRPSSFGQRLPDPVQKKMEAFFRVDFSQVRIHVGPERRRSEALAFTHGSDLYFAPGQYNPETPHGQRLLGHELAHVVQQRAGRVRNPLGSAIAVVQDAGLEQEAERLGRQAASATTPPPIQAKPAGRSSAGPCAAGSPVLPRVSAAAPPSRPVVPGPSPIRPARPAGLAPVQPSSLGASGSTSLAVSPPTKVGENSYRIVAGAVGQPIGSVMVHARGRSFIEVTDLKVSPSYRGQGLGGALWPRPRGRVSNWDVAAWFWPARTTAAVGSRAGINEWAFSRRASTRSGIRSSRRQSAGCWRALRRRRWPHRPQRRERRAAGPAAFRPCRRRSRHPGPVRTGPSCPFVTPCNSRWGRPSRPVRA